MRQKELRIALVCYGGVSLAVYMHGVTKEVWKAVRASQHIRGGGPALEGSEAIYADLLNSLELDHDLQLRVMTDIVAGASAGGINSVFLAQAIHSGQSIEPLTELWLERADVDVLLDPEAKPWSRFAKFWAMPLVSFLLSRPGNAVSDSVAPETRNEVRKKLSRLIRSRWFEPPFSGFGFSNLISEALEAMGESEARAPLLPPDHPLDLFVTATDFKGYLQTMRLHSPALVQESEHRLSIGFRAATPQDGGHSYAAQPELVFASRATASFPGAFPPLQVSEIDRLAADQGIAWTNRDEFLARIMPQHSRLDDLDSVSLIDGSVLVNAPFADAMRVLRDRPAHREVDRRIVYIDPHPDRVGGVKRQDSKPPGFFSVIFGSLSSIPREQPVRDNLEQLEQQSNEMANLRSIVRVLRPEVEATVKKLFGRTLFFDKPTPKRLSVWRAKAQQAACEQAGYAFHGYAQLKFNGIVWKLANTIHEAAPNLSFATPDLVAKRIVAHLQVTGLDQLSDMNGGATASAIDFFREHDCEFRIRRLRQLARRLTQDWEDVAGITEQDRDAARTVIYDALSDYQKCETAEALGEGFADLATTFIEEPGGVLTYIAEQRGLKAIDLKVDAMISEAMEKMPVGLRRPVLLTYLGFPFYDTVTLPLLRGEGSTEFDPVKVDRISPEDALAIRSGGTQATLRGVEFYNFGAFFSRAYRENDYLWGRLHGAERMIDLIVSVLPETESYSPERLTQIRRNAFLAILDEEEGRLQADPDLVPNLRKEVLAVI